MGVGEGFRGRWPEPGSGGERGRGRTQAGEGRGERGREREEGWHISERVGGRDAEQRRKRGDTEEILSKKHIGLALCFVGEGEARTTTQIPESQCPSTFTIQSHYGDYF